MLFATPMLVEQTIHLALGGSLLKSASQSLEIAPVAVPTPPEQGLCEVISTNAR